MYNCHGYTGSVNNIEVLSKYLSDFIEKEKNILSFLRAGMTALRDFWMSFMLALSPNKAHLTLHIPYPQTLNLSRMHEYYPCKIFIFWGKFLLWTYSVLQKIVFLAHFLVLVTYLVSHRFTLGNPILVIPILYLLRLI